MAGTGERSAAGYGNSRWSSGAASQGGRRYAGAPGRAVQRVLLAAGVSFVMVVDAGTTGLADTLAQDRIGRCQDLVRRQSGLVEFLPATWRIWEDPVPKKALPAAALSKIKTHDLLYDGGISGFFKLKAANAPFQAREILAYCSFDNLFVWLQGIYNRGVWTQFDSTDYVLPY